MPKKSFLIERPEAPEAVQFRLTIAGGMNPHGEPNFRVIFGQDARNYYRDETGELLPKYLPRDEWHLEAWLPPEKCPPFGGYEHCCPLGTHLDPGVVNKLMELIKKSRDYTIAERHTAIMDREAKAERDYDSWAFDVLDDGVGAFHEHPFVPLPIRKDLEKNDRRKIVVTD